MPLDGYTYLTSYGWTGRGSGLRKGAIEKPISIPQKRNLAGVGKDRDEAFPFWDHLFTAASKAIAIKVTSDDEEDEDDPSKNDASDIARTSTGIISNRRPVNGTPASETTSGMTTPDPITDPRLSLIAIAKREAAKRGLYSKFFRGPVLGPDTDPSTSTAPSTSSSPPTLIVDSGSEDLPGSVKGVEKKRKRKPSDRAETKEERRERKRLKKERKAAKILRRMEKGEMPESPARDNPGNGGKSTEKKNKKGEPSDGGNLPLPPSKTGKKREMTDVSLPGVHSEGATATRQLGKESGTPGNNSISSCPHNPSITANSKKKKSKRKHIS
ncbi:hypothetical protein ID866_3524 [Astraeus odoratus]|nr:hypothetical protein ID866_3524 [Astraeus odoratus]